MANKDDFTADVLRKMHAEEEKELIDYNAEQATDADGNFLNAYAYLKYTGELDDFPTILGGPAG